MKDIKIRLLMKPGKLMRFSRATFAMCAEVDLMIINTGNRMLKWKMLDYIIDDIRRFTIKAISHESIHSVLWKLEGDETSRRLDNVKGDLAYMGDGGIL